MSTRVHVLLKKEELERFPVDGKVVIVLDVLFATTTIIAALGAGAREVIPTLNGEAALAAAKGRDASSYVLAGELNARTIEGFMHPTPLTLQRQVALAGKTLIYSTTNGTVALRNSAAANAVYAAALVNATAVVDHVRRDHAGESIVVVCSGSIDNFNLEDFYGAGYFASLFARDGEAQFSDAALAARRLHDGTDAKECLRASRVGRMMIERGLDAEVDYAATKDALAVVPVMRDGRVVEAHAMVQA